MEGDDGSLLMKEVKRPHRCAQCGRSYTKAQWRRNDFWCPECKKFVCYDCVGWGMICPACGTKAGRMCRISATMVAGIGGGFLLVSILLLIVGAEHPTIVKQGMSMMGLSLVLIVISIVLFSIWRMQVRMHLETLSRLPSGTIPLEERPGHGDQSVRRRWSEASYARSMRGRGLPSDRDPESRYQGLMANWNHPVMPRREIIDLGPDIRSEGIVWGGGIMALGILILALGIMLLKSVECMALGALISIIGLVTMYVTKYLKKWSESDKEMSVKVSWKTIGFEAAKEAVEGFLEEQGLKARLTTKKLFMWEHPEHRYELPDGNHISFTYTEDKAGHVFGWVEIGYRPSGMLEAKRLQKELDEYLCERDLIQRI